MKLKKIITVSTSSSSELRIYKNVPAIYDIEVIGAWLNVLTRLCHTYKNWNMVAILKEINIFVDKFHFSFF